MTTTNEHRTSFSTHLDKMTPTKPPVHQAAIEAARRWEEAAFYDELDDEAVRRGHINTSIKFADCATMARMHAREAEADARGIELEDH